MKRASSPKSRSQARADTNDERRRYYRVTAAGRKAGREEAERLADLVRIARAKKILKGRVCLTGSVALLLRLYPCRVPPRLRTSTHCSLMWDRAGHERGAVLRARLLMDLDDGSRRRRP